MKSCVLLLFLISFLTLKAQEEESFKKNVVSFETGVWSRGHVGLDYSRNFLKRELLFLTVETFGGVEYNLFTPFNKYLGGATVVNFGRKHVFFMFGLEPKYYKIYEPSGFGVERIYEGFSSSFMMGANVLFNNGFNAKFRLSYLEDSYTDFTGTKRDMIWWSIGGSLGYSFSAKPKD